MTSEIREGDITSIIRVIVIIVSDKHGLSLYQRKNVGSNLFRGSRAVNRKI